MHHSLLRSRRDFLQQVHISAWSTQSKRLPASNWNTLFEPNIRKAFLKIPRMPSFIKSTSHTATLVIVFGSTPMAMTWSGPGLLQKCHFKTCTRPTSRNNTSLFQFNQEALEDLKWAGLRSTKRLSLLWRLWIACTGSWLVMPDHTHRMTTTIWSFYLKFWLSFRLVLNFPGQDVAMGYLRFSTLIIHTCKSQVTTAFVRSSLTIALTHRQSPVGSSSRPSRVFFLGILLAFLSRTNQRPNGTWKERAAEYILPDGLWPFPGHAVWIPKSFKNLQLRLCVVTHTKTSSSCSAQPAESYVWKEFNLCTSMHDHKTLIGSCFNCLSRATGKIPRPFGSAVYDLVAIYILYFDFIEIPASATDEKYIKFHKGNHLDYCWQLRSKAHERRVQHQWLSTEALRMASPSQCCHLDQLDLRKEQNAYCNFLGIHHNFTPSNALESSGNGTQLGGELV